jgi:hypothetical protein
MAAGVASGGGGGGGADEPAARVLDRKVRGDEVFVKAVLITGATFLRRNGIVVGFSDTPSIFSS